MQTPCKSEFCIQCLVKKKILIQVMKDFESVIVISVTSADTSGGPTQHCVGGNGGGMGGG